MTDLEAQMREILRATILASAKEEDRAKLVAQWEKEDADAALLARLNHSPARYWWLLEPFARAHRAEALAASAFDLSVLREVYDGSDIFDRAAAALPASTEPIDLYRAMPKQGRARMWRAMLLTPIAGREIRVLDAATGETELAHG